MEDGGLPSPDLLKSQAVLHKKLGHQKAYLEAMAFQKLSSTVAIIDASNNPDLVLKGIESMRRYAKQTGDEDLLKKMDIIYHRVKSALSNSPQEAARELRACLDSYSKTEGVEGESEARAEYLLAEAMQTVDVDVRAKMLREAAELFLKIGKTNQAGFATSLAIRNVSMSVVKPTAQFGEALKSLTTLERVIRRTVKPSGKPQIIYYQTGLLRERIKNLLIISRRFGKNRKETIDVQISINALESQRKTKARTKEIAELYGRMVSLKDELLLDVESTYIFGNLALDQLARLTAHVGDLPNCDECDYERLYCGIIRSRSYTGSLDKLKRECNDCFVWLYYNLRFYRNNFIEHPKYPRQRGATMSVYREEYSLHVPTPPGILTDDEVNVVYQSVENIMPDWLKNAPSNYWEKERRGRRLERALWEIESIKNEGDRDKLRDAWKVVGGSTPPFHLVLNRLSTLMMESLPLLTEVVQDNPGGINLGSVTSP